jgi:hypothetical protein
LIDSIAHLSALFYQKIEGSGSFISYNFDSSLQPDDVVEHVYRVTVAPGPVLCPGGRTIVLDDSLRRPFVILPSAYL